MDKASGVWLNMIVLCVGLGGIGFMAAMMLNYKFLGCLLAGLAMTGVTFGAVLFGAVGVIHALEGSSVQHIRDGHNEVIISLHLGPFSYRRTLPIPVEEK